MSAGVGSTNPQCCSEFSRVRHDIQERTADAGIELCQHQNGRNEVKYLAHDDDIVVYADAALHEESNIETKENGDGGDGQVRDNGDAYRWQDTLRHGHRGILSSLWSSKKEHGPSIRRSGTGREVFRCSTFTNPRFAMAEYQNRQGFGTAWAKLYFVF